MKELPSFQEAERQFSDFGVRCGWPPTVSWVFRDQLSFTRRKVWVRLPLPAKNLDAAQEYYEYGRRNGVGVDLRGLARVAGSTLAFIWIPRDRIEAIQSFLGAPHALKLSIPESPLLLGVAVDTEIAWRVRVLMNRWSGLDQDPTRMIPTLANVEACKGLPEADVPKRPPDPE